MNLPMFAFRPLQKIFKGMRNRWQRYRNRKADFGAYKRWLNSHPGSTFKEFYVHTIMHHLVGEGGRHWTLGAYPIWEKQGEEILQQLIDLGLRPSDVVVDYGCGTLREGIHLIRYLDAGRYIGLDIDERVLNAGRRTLGARFAGKEAASPCHHQTFSYFTSSHHKARLDCLVVCSQSDAARGPRRVLR